MIGNLNQCLLLLILISYGLLSWVLVILMLSLYLNHGNSEGLVKECCPPGNDLCFFKVPGVLPTNSCRGPWHLHPFRSRHFEFQTQLLFRNENIQSPTIIKDLSFKVRSGVLYLPQSWVLSLFSSPAPPNCHSLPTLVFDPPWIRTKGEKGLGRRNQSGAEPLFCVVMCGWLLFFPLMDIFLGT